MNIQHQETVETINVGEIRNGLSVGALRQAVLDKVVYHIGKVPEEATFNDFYLALSLAVRDRLQHRWINSVRKYNDPEVKIAAYLSAEYLLGPHLGINLIELGILEAAREAMHQLGIDLEDLLNHEEEPGLGNGGLGRLAACYLDSLATLERPAIGYGIRYEYGIFDQRIKDGWQEEITDKWLALGNPWEIHKPEIRYNVQFGGYTEMVKNKNGGFKIKWIPGEVVKGSAYDTPILGYRVENCITLRLWSAQACESFRFEKFNIGDYYKAVDEKVRSETITKVLYPNDEPEVGKALRLKQQYFFVSCSLQDMLRIMDLFELPYEKFPEKFAVQLNDTHPSIGVAELMRLLIDVHGFGWEQAWEITKASFAYTNHTLLPEALETWSLPLFKRLLPRHLEIIFEINHRFLQQVRNKFPGDNQRVARMSLIDESGSKRIRMAHLASVGSFHINGVAELHTKLLKASVLRDFYEFWPEKFSNKTNGVTPRRFILLSNPGLSSLISDRIGDQWRNDLYRLRELENLLDDDTFCQSWRTVKEQNKQRLAQHIERSTSIQVDATWMFDVLIKRIHEYKRQHLQVLHIITRYLRIKKNPKYAFPPRVFIFAGKAAPGYFLAKLIIKLINSVAETINTDPEVNDRLKVVFVPDFNVKNAQLIYPAADLSEQISTAGKEASGTGNMKFAMNGALTIGTLDGANVEIREEVGAKNFFRFGMTVEEVQQLRQSRYHPQAILDQNPELNEVLNMIREGHFSNGDTELFKPIVDNLIYRDPYFLLADFNSYLECQDRVSKAWLDEDNWTRMSILNAARMGKFSSDRSMREYCDEIWGVKKLPV